MPSDFDDRLRPDAAQALASIAPGEEVVYYSGLTPREMARPSTFRPAWEAYKSGRAILAQRRIGEQVGKNADGAKVVFGVFDYVAIGVKRR